MDISAASTSRRLPLNMCIHSLLRHKVVLLTNAVSELTSDPDEDLESLIEVLQDLSSEEASDTDQDILPCEVQPVRGNGRGRGRGRGRPRGSRLQARGSRPTYSRGGQRRVQTRQIQQEEVQMQLKSREDKLKDKIQNLTEQEAKHLLLKIGTSDAEATAIILGTGQPTTPPIPNSSSPDWCVCFNCRPMQTERENTCCGQKPQFCKCNTPGIEITILDRQVLRLAILHRNDLIAEANLGPDAAVGDINKAYRHAAYRQYILLQYGRLGKGVRRIIPSCVVLKIRAYFPDPQGQYQGWREAANRP